MRTQVTKIYLVQIVDKEGNELAFEYVSSRAWIKAAANEMKERLRRDRQRSKSGLY